MVRAALNLFIHEAEMKFVFVGDPKHNGDGPSILKHHGLVFQKNGPPVEVLEPKAIEKLKGNSHFKAVSNHVDAKQSRAEGARSPAAGGASGG